jgi:hypothetical protein
MKATLTLTVLVIISLFVFNKAHAQDVPAEVKSIVGMKLEAGQAKLGGLGYEICYSSLFGKKQDWFNEKAQICVTVKFNKKEEITEVSINPETSECQKKLENARQIRMWNSRRTYTNRDMISIGPTIKYPHSPDEKVNIETVQKYWEFLVNVLENVPEK